MMLFYICISAWALIAPASLCYMHLFRHLILLIHFKWHYGNNIKMYITGNCNMLLRLIFCCLHLVDVFLSVFLFVAYGKCFRLVNYFICTTECMIKWRFSFRYALSIKATAKLLFILMSFILFRLYVISSHAAIKSWYFLHIMWNAKDSFFHTNYDLPLLCRYINFTTVLHVLMKPPSRIHIC